MKTYAKDPYWTTARFDSVAANGDTIKKGDRIFYYPNGRQSFVGQAAIEAAADFESCAQDEAFQNGGMQFGSENY